MVQRSRKIDSRFVRHGVEAYGSLDNKSILMPDPSNLRFTFHALAAATAAKQAWLTNFLTVIDTNPDDCLDRNEISILINSTS